MSGLQLSTSATLIDFPTSLNLSLSKKAQQTLMLPLAYALASSLVLLLDEWRPQTYNFTYNTDIEASSRTWAWRPFAHGVRLQKVDRILFTTQTLRLEKDMYDLVCNMVVNGPGVWFQGMARLLARHPLNVGSSCSDRTYVTLTVWLSSSL